MPWNFPTDIACTTATASVESIAGDQDEEGQELELAWMLDEQRGPSIRGRATSFQTRRRGCGASTDSARSFGTLASVTVKVRSQAILAWQPRGWDGQGLEAPTTQPHSLVVGKTFMFRGVEPPLHGR